MNSTGKEVKYVDTADYIEEKWESRLNPSEKELLALLRDRKTSWATLYLTLRRIRDDRLYQGKNLSFWIRDFSDHAQCSESRLWDALRAGDFYLRWAANKKDVPKLEDLKINPQNLTVIQRITLYDPGQTDKLMMKLINQEIRRGELLIRAKFLKAKALRGTPGTNRPWRELNLKQPPFYEDFDATKKVIDAYYDNASISECGMIVEALQNCADQIKKLLEQQGRYKKEELEKTTTNESTAPTQ